jgi:hypothetical protein
MEGNVKKKFDPGCVFRIKSRDETIAARDAQIAGLQSELDDLRKQLPEAKEAQGG